ncbi:hypothetical protein E2562_024001 [Oryza meyeriana var. granulata]|uniref:WRKY domain-containing protein n=1 Tax=Oryza meyeriana var. granulata TaxID=110450 RepID=A0A6G1EBD4_9ORYZ|nr:hypothetical protein E2562_024001 [Oryza meyeriana var. granulata]
MFSGERRCAAKKQVQQQDGGEPPMFLVTYLNEHTCQAQAVPGTPNTASGSSPSTTSWRQSSSPEVLDSTVNGAGGLFGRHLLLPHAVGGGGSAEEDAAIVTCLATMDYCLSYDPSTFFPVEAAADHHLLIGHGDVATEHVAQIMDTVWPRYTRDTSAWR